MAHTPIHLLVSESARRFPDQAAVESGEGRISYRQLEAKSDRLAYELAAAGLAPGELVGILAERSSLVLAGLLAVLKAGGAFMPLDPAFPTGRLESVLADLAPRCWLLDEAWRERLAALAAGRDSVALVLDDGWPESAPPGAAEALAALPPRDPDGLCYVYFTSGSTGRPKAIGGRFKAIDHFIRWEIDELGLGSETRGSQLVSPAFDAYLRDVLTPLVAGGTVCIPPDRETVADAARLAGWLEASGVTLLHTIPSVFRTLLAQPLSPARFAALRHVLLAGEPLLPSDVRRWQAAAGERIELMNLYGPSETTMVKLFYRVRPGDGQARTIPIGKPMTGARALVVDEAGQPCPAGKMGEIWLRTPYRSLGYLNRPELTAEAFIPNPFSQQADDLIYKTGDLGRLREDGDLEYVGRRDSQVKVRGVRIEIGAIEDALRSSPAVRDVAVIDRDDSQGNKFLCAYVVLADDGPTAALREHLAARLPEAMLPSAFVRLDALPRTLTGKVDRRALPDPGRAGSLGAAYVAPRTPLEQDLAAIFAELLGLPRVGIHDSFFELGGHSLLATLLLARIRATTGVEAPLRALFRAPTVAELALVVTQLEAEQRDATEMAELLAEVQGKG